MLYSLGLFFHVLGAVVMFVAVGITLTAMVAMLYADKTESLRLWSALAVKMDVLMPVSVIFVLLPGLYLVFSTWGWDHAWINVSLTLLLLMSVMGPVINLPRLKLILEAANEEAESIPSPQMLEKVRNRTLWTSVMIMTMLLVGILFLMTVKTTLIPSLLTIAAAAAVGFVIANILLAKAAASVSKSEIA